jgi:lipid-A-disaccharide synthase
VARRLREAHPEIAVVLPHQDPRHSPLIREVLRAEGADFVEFRPGPIRDALSEARLVIAKSGTGSLESCLLGTPTVVVYRLSNPVASLFARSFLSVPWIASANLIAGREVVPEFCFRGQSTWAEVADAATTLWEDGQTRSECIEGLATVRARLGTPGASARVARWILPFCRREAG